ncbi:hypothetical protein DPMN_148841 [Dreissena polymorpha]|uniref:Uncharacterized protein n=1 Tax=Dreissena polymorpha TaxID=45954 RepID=A0A9D4J0L6_DREPO|nr:hypothetical protein DPMN_148841 [Dreissena polymorpha]
MVEEFKVTQVRRVMMLRDSEDEKDRGARASGSDASTAKKRWVVQGKVRSTEAETSQAAAVDITKQGSWLKWEGV